MSGLSVATIKSPEFINITSISPLISKCEIKVMYVGENRNRSFITKEVAAEMAQSLPGTPIVGYYSENKEDFGDHGDQMIIDGDGVKFKCLTKPYGFVSLDTKVWFQEFEDTDEFGNKTLREYLMCEGYLWTEQYQEAKKVLNEGRSQSMELDEKTLKGHWSTDNNRGIEFFIINDAIFSKLCILGEEVEPCFEGSSITAPDVSSNFTLDSTEFKNTLFSMIKELTNLLQDKGGKANMNDEILESKTPEDSFVNADSAAEVETIVEEPQNENIETEVEEEISVENEDKDNQEPTSEIQDNIEDFTKKSEDESKEENDEKGSNEEDSEEDDEDKKKVSKNSLETEYSALQENYDNLLKSYESLKEENSKLVEFKKNVEDKEKDELIASFYMLSDADKEEIIKNKANYTLDEIEKELSVICVRKKVVFDNDSNNESNVALTYNLGSFDEELPAWLQAVEQRRNRK